MFSFLKKPYPFLGEIKRDVISNLMVGAFVALFLIVLQPFQISVWETNYKVLKLLGFGFISFLMPTLLNLLINVLDKSGRLEEKWNILFEILSVLSVLFLITVGNLFYGKLLGIIPFGIQAFFIIFFITCIVGVFPITVHVMLKHNKLLKINLDNSIRVNAKLKHLHEQLLAQQSQKTAEEPKPAPEPEKPVEPISKNEQILLAENEKDRITFNTENLRYIESADNYSTLVSFENSTRKKQLIRSSLKRIESQLTDEFIVRCHRTYIVNLRQVKSAEGNAAGYTLSFYDVEETIPVSRNYVSVVNEKLKAFN
ncbi:MAG: LytTR family transcriptional regulator [Bacteroidia bacterium]|nr:LytTR family transcriptional regulator [Bacteroidia bacterium]